MRELRGGVDSALAARRHRSLPLQRLRSLPQDERHESATGQAIKAHGKRSSSPGISNEQRTMRAREATEKRKREQGYVISIHTCAYKKRDLSLVARSCRDFLYEMFVRAKTTVWKYNNAFFL